MHVRIESTWATMANGVARREGSPDSLLPYPSETWEGEVEVEDLEGVFRFFNRVEAGDGLRLELVGYRLPSLSAGDRVTLDGETWECAAVGWTRVDPDTPIGKPWPL